MSVTLRTWQCKNDERRTIHRTHAVPCGKQIAGRKSLAVRAALIFCSFDCNLRGRDFFAVAKLNLDGRQAILLFNMPAEHVSYRIKLQREHGAVLPPQKITQQAFKGDWQDGRTAFRKISMRGDGTVKKK